MDFEKLAKPFLQKIVPYTPGKPIEQLERERNLDRPAAKLASNENPYPPHDAIKQAVLQAMDSANRYPESGSPEVTELLAGKHGVTPGEVFVANGSNEIIELLIRAYVGADERTMFSQLSFAIYAIVSTQCAVEPVQVPYRNYTHDLEAMADAIDARTKLIFVCNPNNPTATYNTAAEVKAFLDRVPDDVLVVLDEAYHEFVDADDYPDSKALRAEYPNLIVFRTFSKYFSLAGVRIGYAIAHPSIVASLHKLRQPFNVNRLAQAAAIAALGVSDTLRPYVEETIRERRRLREAVLALGWECPPSQTNFVFAVPTGFDGNVTGLLEEQGIIVRPMPAVPGSPHPFRVNTGTVEENDRFIDAIKALAAS